MGALELATHNNVGNTLELQRNPGFILNMRVHGVQFDCVWEDPAANQAKVRQLVEAAGVGRGELLVLPEMFLTGFSLAVERTVQGDSREHDAFLRDLAIQYGCWVLGGVVTPQEADQPFNEAVVMSPDGGVRCRYAKRQPFSLGGEAAVHGRGLQAQVFEAMGMRVAPMICYDLRFPELARDAVRLGAEMLIYIASWPIARVQHWITLLQARAIENQAWVVGVNRCGRDPQFLYPGRSLVVDPHGVIVADASDREAVVQANCDPAVVRQWRQGFPALVDAGLWPEAEER
jgi:predicted amidohydrolase